MKKLDILKSVAGLVVSAGAGAVVGNAIKASTPEDIKNLNKVLVAIGGFALTGMVGEMASKYTAEQIDQLAGAFDNPLKDPLEED